MKPFLLLQSRSEDLASDNEYEGFLRATGLSTSQLERIRVEAAPLSKLNLAHFSGIIVGGSPFDTTKPATDKSDTQKRVEADLFQLLDEVIEKDFPFFGACYGIGMLGTHQGGVITNKYAETVGSVLITLSNDNQDDPILSGVPSSFQAIVGHKEACEQLPTHAALLASSATCPVQMFRIKKNIYATQFHPELDMDGLTVRVTIYKNAGYFPPEDAEKIIEQARSVNLFNAPTVLRNFVKKYTQFM